MINRIRGALHETIKRHPMVAKLSGHKARSSRWPKFEKEWLVDHGTCSACGGTEKLAVHHVRPFHLFPELELAKGNVVTLCMGPQECHLKIGHGFSFRRWNDQVEQDAAILRHNPDKRPAIETKAMLRSLELLSKTTH